MKETLTIDDIKKAVDRLNIPEKHQMRDLLNPLQQHYGIKFMVAPEPPAKLKLSDHIQVSEEFRQKFDLMLLETFGRQKSLTEDKIYFMPSMNIAIAARSTIGVITNLMA